jgi:hypothetical protein
VRDLDGHVWRFGKKVIDVQLRRSTQMDDDGKPVFVRGAEELSEFLQMLMI